MEKHLKTFLFESSTYENFVMTDENEIKQKRILLKLSNLQAFYKNNNLKSGAFANKNYSLTTSSNIDWDFEVYRMKKAILTKSNYEINFKVTPVLTVQANNVLILAMVQGNVQIVKYFLSQRLINVNDSIFGSVSWPSYYILACACDLSIFKCFLKEYVVENSVWAGLTPNLLCAITKKPLRQTNDFDFMTYQEYRLLNAFKGVNIVKANKNYPLFTIDFLCMTKQTQSLRETLERVPEIGMVSYLSFIVQNYDHFILIMTRYGFKTTQEFNGYTPLHIVSKDGAVLTLVYFLYTGFVVTENNENQFPEDVAKEGVEDIITKLFKICTKNVCFDNILKKNIKYIYMSVFSEKHTEFKKLVESIKDKKANVWSVLKYLKYNNENKVLNSSRFAITNLFSKDKTSAQAEQDSARILNKFEKVSISKNDAAVKERYKNSFYSKT